MMNLLLCTLNSEWIICSRLQVDLGDVYKNNIHGGKWELKWNTYSSALSWSFAFMKHLLSCQYTCEPSIRYYTYTHTKRLIRKQTNKENVIKNGSLHSNRAMSFLSQKCFSFTQLLRTHEWILQRKWIFCLFLLTNAKCENILLMSNTEIYFSSWYSIRSGEFVLYIL